MKIYRYICYGLHCMFVFLDFVIKYETLYNILNNISVVFLCVTKSLFAAVRKNMFEK